MARDPFRELLALQDRMNRMFEESMRNRCVDESSTGAWNPPVDIYETPDSFVVKAELAEVRREDIEIRLENGLLTLRGERKLGEDLKKHSCFRRELQYGVFSRTFSLPGAVDPEGIQASYKDGVLCLVIPRKVAPEPRRVEIK